MNAADVEAVVRGQVHYDDADLAVQAAVRDVWDRTIDVAVAGLDFAAEFAAMGRPWVELVDGVVVKRPAGHG